MATGIVIAPKIIADAISTANSAYTPEPVTSEDVKTFFKGISIGKVPCLHFEGENGSSNMYGTGGKSGFGDSATFIAYPLVIMAFATSESPETCNFAVQMIGGG